MSVKAYLDFLTTHSPKDEKFNLVTRIDLATDLYVRPSLTKIRKKLKMTRYLPLSILTIALTSAVCFADRFPIAQYNTVPKCSREFCFGNDGGKTFKNYCDANGFGNNEGAIDQTFLAMPAKGASCAGFCPCTHEYLNGAAH